MTFDEVLNEKKVPVIAIDQKGIIFMINKRFEEEYGWTEEDLIGNRVTEILPPYMRDAHNMGFSRFLSTEEARIIDSEIPLPVYCRNGTIQDAIHIITAQKRNEGWCFAAIVHPGT